MKWAGLFIIPIAAAAIYWLRPQAPDINGPKIENFALYDNQGGFFELWRKKYVKAVVLISHGSECPMMRKQIPYIENLKSKFSGQGIEFAFINPQDSAKDIEQEAKKYAITTPILLDDAQIISRGLQLTRTLEAIVIDTKSWRTVYRGSISDELSFDGDRKIPKSEYLAEALEDYLGGRKVKVETTELTGGCALTYNKLKEVTYSDVRPIFEVACITCHSANGVPPTKLGTYEDARRWGAMIREVIRTYRMPTGGVDPNFGPYDKRQLIPIARAALVHWVESGMPEGKKSTTKETKPAERTPLKVDMRLDMKEAVTVPAEGEFYA